MGKIEEKKKKYYIDGRSQKGMQKIFKNYVYGLNHF